VSVEVASQHKTNKVSYEEACMSDTEDQKLTALSTYIDGKMKRYSLLFSVNGGAFAIAKLMGESDKSSGVVLLGKLRLWHLALGSICFTILLVIDIFLWGQMMKKNFLDDLAFNKPGKSILLLLGALIVLAWVFVALG
jgi:hypothetical protein